MDISSLRERSTSSALTVSELNGYIKRIFDSDRTLSAVTVKGEISNFVNHKSGHLYFSLKDSDSQIRAVMFRSSAQRLKFLPESGMKVLLHGSVAVYQRDGSYQLYVNSIEPDGIGSLYLAYEQLKEKLSGEGLFDDIYKKDIPRFPEKIGVITSSTGAAVRDIINVTGRRYPPAKIYLYPSLVQGDGAVENLISALDYFEKTKLVDVIIIGRGGGSIEDLWAFNSEQLARKIFSMSIPIISAVGHETDFTICDFVSDLRAPTPSAAAELAVPDIRELIIRVDGMTERLSGALIHLLVRKREKLDIISSSTVLKNPLEIINAKRDLLSEKQNKISLKIKEIIEQKRMNLVLKTEKLNAMNPLSVMARGYAVAEKDGAIIKKVKDVAPRDVLRVRFSDGTADARVTKITKKKGAQ